MPVEDIIDMHHVENTLTEAASYNSSIWHHCIAWDPKICLNSLNYANNVCTWMKYFTQGCHNMAKAGINLLISGKTVQQWHAFFRVEDDFILLRK